MPTIKVLLVAGMALFLTFTVLGNITMSEVGYGALKTALGMETTFQHPRAMWRAIHSPAILWAVFGVIVGLQLVCACLCWFGAAQMWVARADLLQFNNAKQLALLGLGLTAAFFFVGWLAIASEWYQMWQSQKMNVLQDAFRSFCEAMLILIWVNTPG